MRNVLKLTLAIGGCLLMAGCYAPIEAFEPNWLYAKRMEIESGSELEPAVADVELALEKLFGTPDLPRWPDFLSDQPELAKLVSEDGLARAAGPISSDEQGTHFGLYRKHCISCHGISGSGIGPASRLLNPYPRDFRLGKFKTKSTPIGSKPTRQDLREVLERGIPGTSMASFGLLEDEDTEALIDYVIYLTLRGEVERQLLTEAALSIDYEAGERLLDPQLENDDPEQFAAQWNAIERIVDREAGSWAEAEERVPAVTGPPEDLPLFGEVDRADPVAQARLEASIASGRQLFQGSVANCSKCHGVTAMGDGMTQDYDDWTKDWSVSAGLDPTDRAALRPMFELGALKPRTIQPRNLRIGVYRGGSRPLDLYYRIVHGIEGTPMPAAPLQPDNPLGLSEREVWDLVNYLLSLPHEALSQDLLATAPPAQEPTE